MIPFDYKLQFRILKLHVQHKGWKSSTTWKFALLTLPFFIASHFIHQFFAILDHIFFPSYKTIPTDQSIFIVGPPRCGTSLFLDLLNKSDQISSMKMWELHFGPTICEKLIYLQLGKLDRFLGGPLTRFYNKVNDKTLGDFKKIHDTSLFHFEEDAMLFWHSGNAPFLLFAFPFSELATPFANFDRLTTAKYKAKYMNYYKACIQKHLYVFGKNKIFLSKNPFFSTYILTLKEHFKDARFIFMTRSPYKVLPSAISLSTYFKGYLQYVDDETMKNGSLQALRIQYTYPLEVLDFKDEKHHAKIRFDDLVADTKTTVEKVLAQFNLDCPDALKQALAERANREKKYVSKNSYSFEKYNVSEKEFQSYFEDILMQYGYEENSA